MASFAAYDGKKGENHFTVDDMFNSLEPVVQLQYKST